MQHALAVHKRKILAEITFHSNDDIIRRSVRFILCSILNIFSFSSGSVDGPTDDGTHGTETRQSETRDGTETYCNLFLHQEGAHRFCVRFDMRPNNKKLNNKKNTRPKFEGNCGCAAVCFIRHHFYVLRIVAKSEMTLCAKCSVPRMSSTEWRMQNGMSVCARLRISFSN